MGFPASIERIAMKAKWNWRKFFRKLKERGIEVIWKTYEEVLELRKNLGDQVSS
jgi:2-iminoacetate synthase ThiH